MRFIAALLSETHKKNPLQITREGIFYSVASVSLLKAKLAQTDMIQSDLVQRDQGGERRGVHGNYFPWTCLA